MGKRKVIFVKVSEKIKTQIILLTLILKKTVNINMLV